MEAVEIIDISPTLSEAVDVWPGDVPYGRRVALDFAKGDNLVLSSLSTTLHVGAHADAPLHYHPEGESIEQRSLNLYMGPCQVVRVQPQPGGRIYPKHLEGRPITAKRVLFHTGSFPDPNHWNEDFCSLSPELIAFLSEQGVCLVGIDTPSVDPQESKVLESHQELFRRNMAVLEGLVLAHVPEGTYALLALPLKLKDADASPVRAVLLKETK